MYQTYPLEPPAGVQLQLLSPQIGAQISGLDLSRLDQYQMTWLRGALLRHQVLFFRAQALSPISLLQLGLGLAGAPYRHPLFSQNSREGVGYELDSRQGLHQSPDWHPDVPFAATLPAVSIVQGVSVPDLGGDGVWVNTAGGYLSLPLKWQYLVQQLAGIHRREFAQARRIHSALHPLVHQHPETGAYHLLLGEFLTCLHGLESTTAASLLNELQASVLLPEYQVRWQWRDDDLVICDNRATMHRTEADYGGAIRHLRWLPCGQYQPQALKPKTSGLEALLSFKPAH
ncbi:TauD/TfdA family dioxygenase [Chitinibacter tainanensis]|uniref:TauD/TfdA dioxygenase family protein n=1 Tax=Chitinibacter tainanensis TaxID=230667 RepID=UPI002355E29F|nr:TauD/TfdA family dioxygenase [Chitinibacter tainanensis]